MAKPILDIHCSYEDGCEYPPDAFINMDDGTVQHYILANKSSMAFQRAWDSLQISIGYQCNLRPRRKNRIHRCNDEHGYQRK